MIVGDAKSLFLPDLEREYPASGRRLRGLRLIHTHPNGEALSEDDLTDLALLRLDMVVAVDNEAGRRRIWRDELTRRAAADQLTAVERDTLQRAIASHARDAAVFEEVMRLIERARAEFGGDGPWDP